jgi:parvulin-like peptidyl-prolyl isomerase
MGTVWKQSRDRKGAVRQTRGAVYCSLTVAALFAAAPWGVAAAQAVLDRVAVVVGNTAITETEVLRAVRLTELLNGEPLDTGPQQRKAAAERLVDQQLIRNEMATGTYPMPADDEAEDMLRDFRQQRFTTEAQYKAALAKYGVTEKDLKEHLLWELAAIRFTDLRFQPNAPDGQSANRAKPGAPVPAGSDVDQQLDSWLKEQRRNTRVKFNLAAFQ